MSAHPECLYCEADQRRADLMIPIVDLGVSQFFLFREQTYRGRGLVAYKGHVNELFELPDAERDAFMKDVARAAKAIQKATGAIKINYGAYSDKLAHLHFHLVPKFTDGPQFGSTFVMMPEPKQFLADAENETLIAAIKAAL